MRSELADRYSPGEGVNMAYAKEHEVQPDVDCTTYAPLQCLS